MKTRVILLLSMLLTASPVIGQSGPDEVVRAFFKAEDEGRWLDAARMLDLKRFEPFRRSALAGLRNNATLTPPRPEDLMKMDPAMPRVVAEYQAKKMVEGFQNLDLLARQFARVPSVDSLAAMSTEEAAARWLEAMSPAWQHTLAYKEMARRPAVDCPVAPDSIKKTIPTEPYRAPTARILGAAVSDSVGYVIVGASTANRLVAGPGLFEDAFTEFPRVMTLRRIGGSWKIAPTHDMPASRGTHTDAIFVVRCKPDSASQPRKN
ncbi:MAG: hypothetical protein ACJ77T_07595 [Gemmatimonadaceae bacterium]